MSLAYVTNFRGRKELSTDIRLQISYNHQHSCCWCLFLADYLI